LARQILQSQHRVGHTTATQSTLIKNERKIASMFKEIGQYRTKTVLLLSNINQCYSHLVHGDSWTVFLQYKKIRTELWMMASNSTLHTEQGTDIVKTERST